MTPFVQLSLFEGPLDLLLHLCRRHELSVVDLPIAQVTEQFLAYLDVMEELEIQVAGAHEVVDEEQEVGHRLAEAVAAHFAQDAEADTTTPDNNPTTS